MSDLVRFGVSLDGPLLAAFDRLVGEQKHTSRSEAIRDLIRRELASREEGGDREVAGAVTYVYDHHRRELLNRLMGIQHDFQPIIVSTQHIHLDHDRCLEIVVVRGTEREIRRLAEMLKSIKGVRHGTLSITAIG